MNLLNRVVDGFITPRKIVFEEFTKNFKENGKKAERIIKKINKQVDKIVIKPEVKQYVESILDKNELDVKSLETVSKSKSYAVMMATTINLQKFLALNFVLTEKGKTQKERIKTCNSLQELHDVIIFLILRHSIYERHEDLLWKENTFFRNPDDTNKGLVQLAYMYLETVLKLKQAIENDQREEAYKVYHKLCSVDIEGIVADQDAIDIFEL